MNIKETATLGLASALVLGCSKYEDGPAFSLSSKNNRLCREWELDQYQGQPYTDSELVFEFEKDGDFSITTTYSYNGGSYSYTTRGSWEWVEGKESVSIQLPGDASSMDISRLTSGELWGQLDGELVEFVAAK
jgi:hypothetical protein